MLSDPFMENRVDKRTSLKPGYLCGKPTDCSEGLFFLPMPLLLAYTLVGHVKEPKKQKQNIDNYQFHTSKMLENVCFCFVFQKSCLLK